MAKLIKNRYEVGARVGKGAYGKVFLAIDKRDDSRKAMKRIDLGDIDAVKAIDIGQEATTLASLSHVNIIKYFDSFRNEEYFYIITEFCEKGSLEDFMKEQKKQKIRITEESRLFKWLKQCASALKYLHDMNRMHRDIKLLNIFLTIDDNVKLGDFGISLTVDGTIETSKGFGTVLYNSPELNKENKYNHKSDIWSLGISFYELAIYELPFKFLDDISHKPFVDLPNCFTREYNSLIKQMLMKAPNERIDSKGILDFLENKNYACKRIESVKKVDLKYAGRLTKMALFNKETKILILDDVKVLIHVCDLNGILVKSINPESCLKDPFGICVGAGKNGDEEIFIYDHYLETVFVFDPDFKLIKKFENNLKGVYYLTIDSETQILYCSHTYDNIVTLLNANDGQLVQKLKIERPVNIKLIETRVYIVSLVDCDRDEDKRKLIKLKRGNYISVLNKPSLEIVYKIQLENWLWPGSLHISTNSNIYTAAFVLDEDGIYSKNLYLFVIDSQNYELKQNVELNDVESFCDALYMNKKLIFSAVNEKDNNEIRTFCFNE